MELGMLVASLFCLMAVIVSGEESRDPSQNEQQTTLSKLEEADHGPLMKALLNPGENSSSESPELQRDKRHKKKGYGERATWKWKKGGCRGGCGGGGGGYKTPYILVPVVVKGYGGGGGCGGKCGGQCGGGHCGGGGGGGGPSYSYAQASAVSYGGKK